jgi:hypothetical protein
VAQQFVVETTLNSCVREARQAIGDTGQAQRLIQTLHGRGYRFVGAVGERPTSPRRRRRRARSWLFSSLQQRERLVPHGRTHLVSAGEIRIRLWYTPVLGQPIRGWRAAVLSPMSWKASASRSPSCVALADATELAAHVGSEAMYRLMQGFFALAQRVMQRYAGTPRNGSAMALWHSSVPPSPMRTMPDGLCGGPRACSSTSVKSPPCGRHSAVSPSPPAWDSTEWSSSAHLGRRPTRLYAALDNTTDVAGRLQLLAGPDTILMSEATRRLVEEEVRLKPPACSDRQRYLNPRRSTRCVRSSCGDQECQDGAVAG